MGQDPNDQGKKKPDLKSALTASQLTAQTTTRTKVAVPQATPKPAANAETTVQAKTFGAPTQAHVPTSVKRDPAKQAPPPVLVKKPAPISGTKKKAPPNAKKVGWDPRMVRRFLSGQITLGQLEEISKDEQYQMAKSGHRLLRQGKLDKAEKIFRGLLSLDPRDAYFHLALGSCAQRRGDAVAAEASYTASLKINPYSAHALANRGEVRLLLGRLVEGAQDLVGALEQDPELKLPPSRRAQATLRMLQAQLLALGIKPVETTSPKEVAVAKGAPNKAPPPKVAPRQGPPLKAPPPKPAGAIAPSGNKFGAPKAAPGALPPRPAQATRPMGAAPRAGAPPPRRPPIKK
ncbi:MAG: tetratricopeptide repeat protein [Deltaproteobacteria bacterium]|nr:tetratricopeptide repeat protein [Deltaproteobacteria bacterium]